MIQRLFYHSPADIWRLKQRLLIMQYPICSESFSDMKLIKEPGSNALIPVDIIRRALSGSQRVIIFPPIVVAF